MTSKYFFKTSIFFSLILSSVVFLSSCSPKDEFINRNSGPGGVSSSGVEDDSASSYKHLSYSIDRGVEVLQVLKALLNSDYAAKNGFVIQELDQKKVISYGQENKKNKKQIKASPTHFHRNELNYIVSGTVNEMNLFRERTQEEIIQEKFGANSDKTEITLKNLRHLVSIKKLDENSQFEVSIIYDEEVNQYRKQQMILMNVITMTFEWDGTAEGLNKSISILSVKSEVRRYGRKGFAIYESKTTNLSVDLNDSCISINGDIVFNELIKKSTLELKYTDSSVDFGSAGGTYSAIECSQRPAVDLRKIL